MLDLITKLGKLYYNVGAALMYYKVGQMLLKIGQLFCITREI